jgi:hypothetical protein
MFVDHQGSVLSEAEFCPPPSQKGVSEDRVELLIERAVGSALEEHESKMVGHMEQQYSQIKALISSAFPGGDPHGHRMAHEAQIRQADGFQKLKAEVVLKFITGGLWVAAAWAAVSLWNAFISNIKTH